MLSDPETGKVLSQILTRGRDMLHKICVRVSARRIISAKVIAVVAFTLHLHWKRNKHGMVWCFSLKKWTLTQSVKHLGKLFQHQTELPQ